MNDEWQDGEDSGLDGASGRTPDDDISAVSNLAVTSALLAMVCIWQPGWRPAAELGGAGPINRLSLLGLGLALLDCIPLVIAGWGFWLVCGVRGATIRGFTLMFVSATLALLPAAWVLLRIHQSWAVMNWRGLLAILSPLLALALTGLPIAFARRVEPAMEDDKLPEIPTIDDLRRDHSGP